jgi:predicted N-formylglutamate amidohydrolase
MLAPVNKSRLDGAGAPTRNSRMTKSLPPTILTARDGPPAEVLNPGGKAAVCLVCEHASPHIPVSLSELGLAPENRHSHAVWDIGAADVAKALAETLDAPLVISRVSRLVYDCNRNTNAPDAMPEMVENIDVPGNRALSDADRRARVIQVYVPFRDLLARTLTAFASPPALITIHSYSPTWLSQPRDVEIGILHDTDDRLAKRMLTAARKGTKTRLNEPYSAADGVMHTLKAHALPWGLQNVMIEVRNDLISDAAGVARMASQIADMLTSALAGESTG